MSDPKPNSSLRDLFKAGRFLYGAELVTTRGMPAPDQPSKLVELGEGTVDYQPNYDGSFQDWSGRPELPVSMGAGDAGPLSDTP